MLVIKSCDLYFFWQIFYQNWIQVQRNSWQEYTRQYL